MSVAYILDRFPVRTQTFVRLEIEELRRQGTPVQVFALRHGDGPSTGDAVVLRDLAGGKARHARAHARAALRSPVRYARFLRTVRALRSERAELLARRLPLIAEDIVASGATRIHAHFAWSGAAVAQAVAALTGLPWSLTVHGHDLFGDTRNLGVKLASADRVVTVCAYNQRELADRWGVTADIVVCGVELPEPWVRPEPEVDIVFTGRLVEKKGVDVLLRAADPAWTIDIVGDGPQRAELEALAASQGLRRVRFLGALDHAATLDHIGRARVFCLPARIAGDGDRDSMPVVVKEAMARAVPVVASAVVAIPEMVDDSCGWLVAPDDPAALRTALASALTNTPDSQRRGEAGRRRVGERFTLSAEVARLRTEVLAA